MPADEFDYDWIVVGSGFGGSVAALRLAERGYSVGVLECGRRYESEDLPKSTWDLRKYFWMPKLGLRGILRITLFKDVSILSGSGVGGGSLVYGATLYRGTDRFRAEVDKAVGETTDLDPYYEVAERMLGVVDTPRQSSRDRMMLATTDDLGMSARQFHQTRMGAFFGEPGQTVPDPYFGGEGLDRAGCTFCGRCMVGCPNNAKNTLDKNYLHLAQRRGATITAERMVTDVRPAGAPDGSDGYLVTSVRPGAWFRRRTQVQRARGVVFAAGPIGTNQLLAGCKQNGSLPGLSDRLGHDVRTNAESIGALTLRDRDRDIAEGVGISGSLWINDDIHLESVTYGGAADSLGLFFLPLTTGGTRLTRPLQLVGRILRHPVDFLRSMNPRGWSRRSMSVGAMWNRDGALELRPKGRRFGKGVRLQTHPDPNNPNPTVIPEANDFLSLMADKYDGIPQLWATEAFDMPFTAHILGGAIIGTSPETGVIDPEHHVYGYRNLLVTDGSAMPSNAGVNPSLSITALAERAMASIPAKDGTPFTGGVGYQHGCQR
ncbi:GMC oxidoreductase [Amycolatopsis sp. cg13]|uniref:GMC oxidoreductase n=1 Tax=Amycolatopsis sp. cg13 TaxID=3238807 RepID=UPI003525FE2D